MVVGDGDMNIREWEGGRGAAELVAEWDLWLI